MVSGVEHSIILGGVTNILLLIYYRIIGIMRCSSAPMQTTTPMICILLKEYVFYNVKETEVDMTLAVSITHGPHWVHY